MGKVFVSNAFSLSMLSQKETTLRVKEISTEEAREILAQGYDSAVGHEATAKLASQQLGLPVPVNRKAISLKPSDKLLVLQLLQRLPEGKVLNDEESKMFPMKWFLVEVLRGDNCVTWR